MSYNKAFIAKYAPTTKWWTATVVAAGTVAGAALTGDGINTDTEILMVIGLVVQRLVAYATRNAPNSS